MRYAIEYTERAKDDLREYKRSGEKKLLLKIEHLIEEIEEHPYTGTGKPEPLKYGSAGCWSRRINKHHRIVYKVMDEHIVILVLQLRQHYND